MPKHVFKGLKSQNDTLKNVALNEKIHIFSKFGAILSIIVDFGFLQQTQEGKIKWKIPKNTIVNEIAPNLD